MHPTTLALLARAHEADLTREADEYRTVRSARLARALGAARSLILRAEMETSTIGPDASSTYRQGARPAW